MNVSELNSKNNSEVVPFEDVPTNQPGESIITMGAFVNRLSLANN